MLIIRDTLKYSQNFTPLITINTDISGHLTKWMYMV